MTVEERRERDREYYWKTRERRLELNKQRYKDKKPQFAKNNRSWVLKTKYGIDLTTYEEMETQQNGLCFLCEEPDVAVGTLAVDHCHVSGKVRSLLCGNCNRALGLFKDNPQLLDKAANYLRAHGGTD